MPLLDWPILTVSAEQDRDRCAATLFDSRQAREHHPRLGLIATQ